MWDFFAGILVEKQLLSWVSEPKPIDTSGGIENCLNYLATQSIFSKQTNQETKRLFQAKELKPYWEVPKIVSF